VTPVQLGAARKLCISLEHQAVNLDRLATRTAAGSASHNVESESGTLPDGSVTAIVGKPIPVMRFGLMGWPEMLYLPTMPGPRFWSATKMLWPETAIPKGCERPVINVGLIKVPEVVYSPIVSSPRSSPLTLFRTKRFEPEMAMPWRSLEKK
jgi:hypothetical protein